MINVKTSLREYLKSDSKIQIPDVDVEAENIKIVLVNEVVPEDAGNDFYGAPDAEYLKTAIPILQQSGLDVMDSRQALEKGVYITNAVKVPKTEYSIPTEIVKEHSFLLEKELNLFPNLAAIGLMGDVARKAVNYISKRKTKKNVIPSGSTYKIRMEEYYYNGIRVFPSYIITGGNLLIEKSKITMITEDLGNIIRTYL